MTGVGKCTMLYDDGGRDATTLTGGLTADSTNSMADCVNGQDKRKANLPTRDQL
jgi:hypothetical protein